MEDGSSTSCQLTTPTFHERETMKTQKPPAPEQGALLPAGCSTSGSKRNRREMEAQEEEKGEEEEVEDDVGDNDDDDDNEEEVVDVERKILELKRLVPGGESSGIEKLLQETANYIVALQCQIRAMRVVDCFLQGLEQKRRKCGG